MKMDNIFTFLTSFFGTLCNGKYLHNVNQVGAK